MVAPDPISHRQDTCLACGGPDLVDLIDLGVQPHANDFSTDGTWKFVESLRLRGCRGCGHAQQAQLVRPELLFLDYHYASGTSRTLKAYFDTYAGELAARIGTGTSVLEVACNDGSFLASLRDRGFSDLIGVDPAANVAAVARAQGFTVETEFFGAAFAARHGRRCDLIVAQNVLAHTPAPLELLAAMKTLLADDGEVHVQTSQANMIFQGEFDTVYHEHFSFFSAWSMQALARRAGLVLVHLDMPAIHGTSFRFVLRHDGVADDTVAARLAFEQAQGLLDGACFGRFRALAELRVAQYRADLAAWRAEGHLVVGVGAAAKAVTFFNVGGVFPDHIVDEAPLKIGRWFPGSTVQVEGLDAVAALPDRAVFVIGAWNFFTELVDKLVARRGDGRGDRFVRYLPEREEVTC